MREREIRASASDHSGRARLSRASVHAHYYNGSFFISFIREAPRNRDFDRTSTGIGDESPVIFPSYRARHHGAVLGSEEVRLKPRAFGLFLVPLKRVLADTPPGNIAPRFRRATRPSSLLLELLSVEIHAGEIAAEAARSRRSSRGDIESPRVDSYSRARCYRRCPKLSVSTTSKYNLTRKKKRKKYGSAIRVRRELSFICKNLPLNRLIYILRGKFPLRLCRTVAPPTELDHRWACVDASCASL